LLSQLNKLHQDENPAEKELAARIESFEMAYRMQSAAPEALDIDSEPAHVLSAYGVDDDRCAHFARQCLMARRMVERGVRFVQIYSGGMENQRSWDGHNDIRGNHSQFAGETDQPIAALLQDLSQRGLLDSTLVIWGGEFGRLPVAQKSAKPGRDHNPHAMAYWLAGGGVRGGTSFGATDEIGHKAAENRVNLHDLHATILHLMGLNHTQLTFRHNGRDFRLTDVEGEVISDVIA
jgi:arylsulfatase A-like enzyme